MSYRSRGKSWLHLESSVSVTTLFACVVSCGFRWLVDAIYGISSRRRDDRRRDTRRWFASVVSCGSPAHLHYRWCLVAHLYCRWCLVALLLICITDGVLWRQRNAYCRRSRHGFASVMGLQVSCRMSSRGSRIVEYDTKIVIPKPKIFTETLTQDSLGFVSLVPVIYSPKQTILQFCSLRRIIFLTFFHLK
jgi:hypothetical protein